MSMTLSLLLASALALADPPPRSPILGKWTATSANAQGASFEFEPAEKVVWRTHGQAFSLAYRLDRSVTPWTLDLVGFAEGPLKGRTLYCIAEIARDRLRMDCEPGAPNAEGVRKRPAAFVPAQTQEFERAR